MPDKVWQRHWNVDSRPAGSGENALRYLARYIFKTATGNRRISGQRAGKLRWPYRESKTGRDTSIQLDPLEWMSRFLQHILPPGFARVRTFGWLHPAAKVRANRVRALLRQAPVLTPAEQQTWQPPGPPAVETPPETSAAVVSSSMLLCPRCGHVMRRVGSWRPPQPPLRPKQPP